MLALIETLIHRELRKNARLTPAAATNPKRQRGKHVGASGGRGTQTRRVSSHRRGTIYVAVLGVALIVGAVSATAIHLARTELHQAVTADEIARARLAAQSGIEYAIAVINSNDNWRSDYTNGNLTTAGSLAPTGEFSFTLTDSDHDLNDDVNDAVTLRSVGTVGVTPTVCVMEVLLQPADMGLNCLESSLHSGGSVSLDFNSEAYRISSNENITINGGKTLTVEKDAWAVGTITGSVNPSSARLSIQSPPREMPDPDDVFEYYKTNGTWIPISALGANTLERIVLSPATNPYTSETNPQGIYVIDCQNMNITLRECRILGTLVLLNAGTGTIIENKISMEAAISNFPVLMVQGSLAMNWNGSTPVYRSSLVNGSADGEVTPSWPGGIRGLVYMTDALGVQHQAAKVEGVVVTGGMANINYYMVLEFDTTFFNNPPPGFASGNNMKIVPGSWKRVAH